VEAAVTEAGDNPDAALRSANEALAGFLADPGIPETGELADWGRRFIEGRISLLRFSLLERHGLEAPPPVTVVGRLSGGPESEITDAAREELRLPPHTSALRVEREGLVPGAGPGDFVLFSPGQEPGSGGMAIVGRGERRYLRRVFTAPGGQILLVPPGAVSDASLPPGNYDRREIRIEGRVTGLHYGSAGRRVPTTEPE
jgi:hypothetical protein